MYYIKEEKDELVKYKVDIDTDKLKELRETIVVECGKVTHHSYESTHGPNQFDYRIQNYKETFIGIKEYNDFLSPCEDIFKFEYDEYEEPHLVKVINEILSGKTSSIPLLDEKSTYNDIETIDKEIEDQINKINLILTKGTKIKAEELEEESKILKALQEKQNLNADRKLPIEYYEQVKNCIKLIEISRIKISVVEEVNSFFKKIDSKNIDNRSKNKIKIKL